MCASLVLLLCLCAGPGVRALLSCVCSLWLAHTLYAATDSSHLFCVLQALQP